MNPDSRPPRPSGVRHTHLTRATMAASGSRRASHGSTEKDESWLSMNTLKSAAMRQGLKICSSYVCSCSTCTLSKLMRASELLPGGTGEGGGGVFWREGGVRQLSRVGWVGGGGSCAFGGEGAGSCQMGSVLGFRPRTDGNVSC